MFVKDLKNMGFRNIRNKTFLYAGFEICQKTSRYTRLKLSKRHWGCGMLEMTWFSRGIRADGDENYETFKKLRALEMVNC